MFTSMPQPFYAITSINLISSISFLPSQWPPPDSNFTIFAKENFLNIKSSLPVHDQSGFFEFNAETESHCSITLDVLGFLTQKCKQDNTGRESYLAKGSYKFPFQGALQSSFLHQTYTLIKEVKRKSYLVSCKFLFLVSFSLKPASPVTYTTLLIMLTLLVQGSH